MSEEGFQPLVGYLPMPLSLKTEFCLGTMSRIASCPPPLPYMWVREAKHTPSKTILQHLLQKEAACLIPGVWVRGGNGKGILKHAVAIIELCLWKASVLNTVCLLAGLTFIFWPCRSTWALSKYSKLCCFASFSGPPTNIKDREDVTMPGCSFFSDGIEAHSVTIVKFWMLLAAPVSSMYGREMRSNHYLPCPRQTGLLPQPPGS